MLLIASYPCARHPYLPQYFCITGSFALLSQILNPIVMCAELSSNLSPSTETDISTLLTFSLLLNPNDSSKYALTMTTCH
jgi:hypothetical protein